MGEEITYLRQRTLMDPQRRGTTIMSLKHREKKLPNNDGESETIRLWNNISNSDPSGQGIYVGDSNWDYIFLSSVTCRNVTGTGVVVSEEY